jgi:hypothetical protein
MRSRGNIAAVFGFLGVDDKSFAGFYAAAEHGEEKRYVAPWFEKTAPQFLQKELREPKWMPWKINGCSTIWLA